MLPATHELPQQKQHQQKKSNNGNNTTTTNKSINSYHKMSSDNTNRIDDSTTTGDKNNTSNDVINHIDIDKVSIINSDNDSSSSTNNGSKSSDKAICISTNTISDNNSGDNNNHSGDTSKNNIDSITETDGSTNHQWVVDSTGYGMMMQPIQGKRFVGLSFHTDAIAKMTSLPVREDDVILVSYPKSGTHWMHENLRCLIEGRVSSSPESDSHDKMDYMIELKGHGYYDAFPSPRLLNTHVLFHEMPTDILKGQTKLVFIYRNPKDIAVSYYHHHRKIERYAYTGKFCHFLKRFAESKAAFGDCFEYWKSWEGGLRKYPDIPCLIVRYEDLHLDPLGQRRRLAKFLGKIYSDEFLEGVARATSIEAIKIKKGEKGAKTDSGDLIFYRKGEVGDWKNYFTESENVWFDEMIDKEMGGSKLFSFIYSI